MAGYTNGVHSAVGDMPTYERFSDLPTILEIPVHDGVGDESLELPLQDLPSDDTTELCNFLENEHAARTYWITIALAYARQNQLDNAIDILTQGLQSLQESGGAGGQKNGTADRVSYLSALCWMNMWKCRDAPRLRPGELGKDFFLSLDY
jgi:RNA polymerase-associated protein CTR9